MDIAILLIIFNRLDTLKKVFSQIKKVKPKRLYIGADGPRASHKDDAENVEEVRKWIVDNIDWECEVHKLFREKNLGIEKALPEAVSWMFETEEMGIILEDDCLPSISFFEFCRRLLNKYKNNEKVRSISGSNFPNKKMPISKYSYEFGPLSGTWGWATWKRAWQDFDLNLKMQDWENIRKDENLGKIFDKLQANHVKNLFDYYYNNTITWDVEYIVNNLKHVIKEGAVNIGVPVNKNLISNIGTNGTHYSEESVFQNQNLDEIDFDNFIDPPEINIDRKLVNFAYLNVMYLYILDKYKIKDKEIGKIFIIKHKMKYYIMNLKKILSISKKSKIRHKDKLLILQNELEIIKEYKKRSKYCYL